MREQNTSTSRKPEPQQLSSLNQNFSVDFPSSDDYDELPEIPRYGSSDDDIPEIPRYESVQGKKK